ncbi:hypothetical protein NP233_g12965 [Leucocoprinus birnbaumii]|uniref:FAD/NAD(P)-binding domain-containing protein n=1 Tax=Leucocoprinus birnbaumii TaxID=56174 RepID=A0AAD5VFI1_9AGAR|nr:hypothetical protein NP233_g12965 [Leucocoprinus birnbaumii]
MRFCSGCLFLGVSIPAVLCSQSIFTHPRADDALSSSDAYELEWPVKRVAVIGAGVGGLTAYRELKKDGFDVHIFERDYLPGGNWLYTDEVPFDAPIPNAPIANADFEPSLPPQGVTKFPYIEEHDNRTLCSLQRRAHRAPKPIWNGLVTNTPAPVSQIRGFPWPDGTPWAIPQAQVNRYLRAFASWNGVNANDNSPDISYNTRVELIEKRHDPTSAKQIGWTLITKQLEEIEGGLNRATWDKKDFDAVVIASGRFNAPNIPTIQGLEIWGQKFPGKILHSRQYRRPEDYANKTIVIVGAAPGGSTERPTTVDWARLVPLNASIVAEIKRFHPPGETVEASGIELVDGTILRGVDSVIFSSGYIYTYPFLPEYHRPDLGRAGEAPKGALQPIVTDGSHLRSLHLDTFYIDNPTLGFVNCNQGLSPFSYPEFQSFALSMVWAGKANLPSKEAMWALYRRKVEEVGYGKKFTFLGGRATEMIRFFRGWLNAAADKNGGRQIDGLLSVSSQVMSLWTRAVYGDPWLVRNVTIPGATSTLVDLLMNSNDQDLPHVLFNDDW